LSRVLVLGLGVTGDAVVRHRAVAGDDVVVVEDGPTGEDAYRDRVGTARAAGAEIVEHPAPDRLVDLVRGADVVVPSPGVPLRHPALVTAREAGVSVRAEVDLAAELAAHGGKVLVAVTGTNGKTTVTTLITAMLDSSGNPALGAGNIGLPLLDAAATDARVLVAEVSSFQLACTTEAFRPRVAVLLNVAPDHLDWHGSFDEYVAAKARVFAHQRDRDRLVFNGDDDVASRLAESAPAQRVAFTLESRESRPDMFRIEDGMLVDPAGTPFADVDGMPVSAPHDRANALAAAAAAFAVGAARASVERALREYPRLHHRVARIGNTGGVHYYDDSKATNPHATASAVAAFDEFDGQVVLIAGGRNKGLDLSVLRRLAARLRGVVAMGEAGDEVEAVFAGTVPVAPATSMAEAVTAAARLALPGDVVLLSPACASFDWYPSYSARGNDFASEVARLSERGVA
jgi:UDP-N-acetylmuramoylalanine--D-glutamate ligase